MKPVSPQEWMTHFNFLAEADPHLVVSWVPHLFPLPGAAEPHVLLEAVAAAASPWKVHRSS